MSSSNCCFLTCIQASQEAGEVFPSLEEFPQFVVIHTVKGFGTVSKVEAHVFLEFSRFFDGPVDVGLHIHIHELRLGSHPRPAPWVWG